MNGNRARCSPSVVLISTPCQGFSTANSGGKDDAQNNQLIRSVGDILKFTNPLYVVYENVSDNVSSALFYDSFLIVPLHDLFLYTGFWVCTLPILEKFRA